MKGTIWIVVTLLLIAGLGTGTAGAATRPHARSSVAAAAKPVDLVLHDAGGYATLLADAGSAATARNSQETGDEVMTAGQPATHLGYPLSRKLSIGLDFRQDVADASRGSQALSDGDIEEYLTRNLLLGFHCKF